MSLSLILTLITAAQAGALGPAVKVKRVVPPANIVQGVKKLEIGDFSGFGGTTIGSEIRQALQDPTRTSGTAADGSLIGDIVDLGGDLAGDAISTSLGGGAGGLIVGGLVNGVVDSAADEIGSNTLIIQDGLKVNVYEVVTEGGDARLSGKVELSEKNETYKAKQAKRDGKGNIVKDSNGKTVYVEVDCARRIVTTDIHWNLVDASSTLLVEKGITRTARDSKCGSKRGELASKDELGKNTLNGIGSRIANELAPYWSESRLTFQRDKSIKEVIELNRKDQPQAALCAAREVVKADPYSVEANLALGVLHEGLGFVNEAIPYYKKAASVNNDKESLDHIRKVESRVKELSTLESVYGLTYTVGEPDYAWCPKLPDGRPVLVKKDATLWSARDPKVATKVVDVPKGMKLYVIEETPDLLRVVTTDGREGWVDGGLVK